jgi:SNF2 family DNA or RNA helicase
MTATIVPRGAPTPTRLLPNGELYFSEEGLYDFQVDGIAEACLITDVRDGVVAVWDTGIGKSHLAMAVSAYLFADDLIDLVMVVAEKNKIREWHDDFVHFTALSPHLYHGTGRERRFEKAPSPHVFITTYETGRNELLAYQEVGSKRGKGHKVDGPLVDILGLRQKRILWIFDEPTKLRKRSSENHKAYDYILNSLRKGSSHQRVLGLTATPLERDMEDAYNIGRIVAPSRMPTVARFDELFVSGRDNYGRPRFKPGRDQVFAQMFQEIVLRKRKTDPDVLNQFPKQVEESVRVPLLPEHAKLYEAVEAILDPPEGEPDSRSRAEVEAQERQLYTVLRMVAGHPSALLRSQSELAATIIEAVGIERIREIRSSKSEALLAALQNLIRGQGAQVVIFTFFAKTVLPEIQRELTDAGYLVSIYHGGQTHAKNEDEKQNFLQGRTEILLASDAAARGINLKNAQYVIEYESALTYANRKQRLDRVHRIFSDLPSVTCMTMIAENTIEEGLVDLMLSRNRSQDTLLGDSADGTAFISAADRRRLLGAYRNRRRRK